MYVYNDVAQRGLPAGASWAGACVLGRLRWLDRARLSALAASNGLFATSSRPDTLD